MSKPREFWISPEDAGTDAYVSETPLGGLIHVIEKTAYDELKVEVDRLTEKCETLFMKGQEVTSELYEQLEADHVREIFKAKEINELKEQVENYRSILKNLLESEARSNFKWTSEHNNFWGEACRALEKK